MFYLRLNPAKRKLKTETVTEEMKNQHRHLSTVDYQVYEHFYKMFKDKLDNQDADFHAEVKVFNEIMGNITQFCYSVDYMEDGSPKNFTVDGLVLNLAKNPYMDETNFTVEDCGKLQLMPDDFTMTIWRQTAQKFAPFFRRKKWPDFMDSGV